MSARGCGFQDTTMQNKIVLVRGGVLRTQDQQGRSFNDPRVVKRIKDWPVPKSGKEVATFLGFEGYYRTFIPQYSALTNGLNWIKKAEKFVWNEEIERDFVELKRAFANGGIPLFPTSE